MSTSVPRSRFGACLFVLLACPAAAFADEPSRGWSVQVTPYVWALGIEGRVRPGAGLPTVDVDVGFGEMLQDVDFAAFAALRARREDVLLVADASWSNASRKGAIPPGVPAKAGVRQASLTLLGGRTVFADERRSLALLAGVRGWSIRTRAEVPLAGLRVSPALDFVDPLVAAQLEWRFDDRWSALVHADAGGFGVGSESTWQLLAVANYALHARSSVSVGYRHLSVDYRTRGVVADVAESGPLVGFSWRF